MKTMKTVKNVKTRRFLGEFLQSFLNVSESSGFCSWLNLTVKKYSHDTKQKFQSMKMDPFKDVRNAKDIDSHHRVIGALMVQNRHMFSFLPLFGAVSNKSG